VIIVNNTTVTAINWNKTLKEFAESGLPAKTFAEKNGIKPNSLYWQLRKRRSASGSVTEEPQDRPVFIPVISEPAGTGKISVTVGHATINIEPGFDQQMLADVVRALGAVC
jgi:hypothetical protein